MSARSSRTARTDQGEYLSERGQMCLLLLAVVVFALSVALALAFANARIHHPSSALQRARDAGTEHALGGASPTRT